MNAFKAACIKLATAWDYNAKCVKRRKGDGKKIRRYARRKLKREGDISEVTVFMRISKFSGFLSKP